MYKMNLKKNISINIGEKNFKFILFFLRISNKLKKILIFYKILLH